MTMLFWSSLIIGVLIVLKFVVRALLQILEIRAKLRLACEAARNRRHEANGRERRAGSAKIKQQFSISKRNRI